MLRYAVAAVGFKLLASNRVTQALYRHAGNRLARRRVRIPFEHYVRHGNLFVELCQEIGAFENGNHALELGTGWYHWYSVYLRSFFEVRITMVDVSENRDTRAMRLLCTRLRDYGNRHADHRAARVADSYEAIRTERGLEGFYERLNLTYLQERTAPLARLPDRGFDLVFSFNVLEHVPAGDVQATVNDLHRILKPGGHSIHQIGLDDHLSHHDPTTSIKQYLCFSDQVWDGFFSNDLLYMNRLQVSDFLRCFEKAGFTLRRTVPETRDLGALKVAPRFHRYSQEDLNTVVMTLVHQKREAGSPQTMKGSL